MEIFLRNYSLRVKGTGLPLYQRGPMFKTARSLNMKRLVGYFLLERKNKGLISLDERKLKEKIKNGFFYKKNEKKIWYEREKKKFVTKFDTLSI